MVAEPCLTASDKRPLLKEEKLASRVHETKHDETDHTKQFHNEMIKEMLQEQVLEGTMEQRTDISVLETRDEAGGMVGGVILYEYTGTDG